MCILVTNQEGEYTLRKNSILVFMYMVYHHRTNDCKFCLRFYSQDSFGFDSLSRDWKIKSLHFPCPTSVQNPYKHGLVCQKTSSRNYSLQHGFTDHTGSSQISFPKIHISSIDVYHCYVDSKVKSLIFVIKLSVVHSNRS
jgi:hypothetical protein